MNLKLRDELCHKLIEQEGACDGLDCSYCPGYRAFNDDSPCSSNSWRKSYYRPDKDEQTIASAKKWLKQNTGEKIDDFIEGKTYIYIDTEHRGGWSERGGDMDKVLDNKPVKCTIHTRKKFAAFDRTRETGEWDWKQGFENWRLVNVYENNIFDEGEL
jgi:hypothetical protein